MPHKNPTQGDSLFSSSHDASSEPLAARMRPQTIDDFVGQDHILGEGRLLRRAIQADRLSSLIFAGPPGTGKTTLARVIANTTAANFVSVNAVLSGVKEIREAVDKAKAGRDLYDRRTILFVDEVHRWNKAQQDALLPWVENGTIILIGATTENPFFEVNSALVSRSRVFQLKALDADGLRRIAKRALSDPARGYGRHKITITDEALEHLIDVADGDARSLLGAIELAVETTPANFPPPPGEEIRIDLPTAEESIQRRAVLYDKEGDYHYDTISAFIKSLRGSDPDAALYWMARMIRAGEDPHFLFRRMIILASEDVGLADPQALVVVESAARAFDRVGMPEGQFHLTQAVLYLSTCAKSNSSMGFFDALAAVDKEGAQDVPSHLKDASRDKEGFGHGEGYMYPHAYRDHWVAQAYLPAQLRGRVFYTPGSAGYEARIHDDVLRRREAQLEAVLETPEEILTYSPEKRGQAEWLARAGGGRGKALEAVRDRMFALAEIRRHYRVLAADSGSGLLVWEALRQAPEGGVWAVFANKRDYDIVASYTESLPEIERPVVIHGGLGESGLTVSDESAGGKDAKCEGLPPFEVILARNLLTRAAGTPAGREEFIRACMGLLAPGGRLVLAQTVPALGSRFFAAAPALGLEAAAREKILAAEEEMYAASGNPLLAWGPPDLEAAAARAGLRDVRLVTEYYEEERLVSPANIAAWFGPLFSADTAGASGYAAALMPLLDAEERQTLKTWLESSVAGKVIPWKSCTAFVTGLAAD
ncbi:MAG: AAA family ATPase [Spirochaetales bacterium]|jgi:putative ATPase|nr:AAA family ATPase [Spirochaetales bacterium]